MTALSKPNSILGWAAWVGGAALGWYAGVHLLIPRALTLGAYWALNKSLKKQNPYVAPAAMQVGQLMWIGFGLLMIGQWDLNVGDCIVLAIGAVWLLARPGLPPVIFLTAYQVFGLAINVYAFSEATMNSAAAKALPVHITWRALALMLMWRAYLQGRKMPTGDQTVVPTPPVG